MKNCKCNGATRTNDYKGKPIGLSDVVDYADGSIVSKTLLDRKAGTLTLFAFDSGQGLSEHTSPYDATLYILEGTAKLMIGGREVLARAGEMVIMPANIPHSVNATERFKMLLIMIR